MTTLSASNHQIVDRAAWLEAHRAQLVKEKAFTRQREAMAESRRELPWLELTEPYIFDTPDGETNLAGLFGGRSQLVVYHFMFGPDWEEGCPSCSYLADHFDGAIVHLNHRDVSMVVASRAPLDKLEGYRKRMGWRFKWLSSLGSDFNGDYHVSFADEEIAGGAVYYNYRMGQFPSEEAPGLSVFHKHANGDIFHTYSAYARGLDMLIGAYNLLDLVPKGRDEAGLSFTMEWLRRHDRYED